MSTDPEADTRRTKVLPWTIVTIADQAIILDYVHLTEADAMAEAQRAAERAKCGDNWHLCEGHLEVRLREGGRLTARHNPNLARGWDDLRTYGYPAPRAEQE